MSDNAIRDARASLFQGATGFDVVDLSETLHPDSVIWPGAPALSSVDAVTYDNGGYHARVVTVFEHAGTHFDAPEHFHASGHDAADVPADQLVVAVRVIDFTEAPASDGNAVLQVADIERHEAEFGPIPAGTAVLLNTGWAAKRHDAQAYSGSPDGSADNLVFPGFGLEASQALVDRGVVGFGVDTLGIDPGDKPDFPVHRDITHPNGLWHLENLVNVDQLPGAGALLIVGVPRIGGASGFPTRVLALVPTKA